MSRPSAPSTPTSGAAGGASEAKFFWHGVLWLNDLGEHAFFDVKVNATADFAQATIYTSDLPPLPVRAEDNLHVMFLLENSTGVQTIRYKVAEASIKGSLVLGKAAESEFLAREAAPDSTLRVAAGDAEFVYMLRGGQLLLSHIYCKVPQPVARKYLTLQIQP